LDGVGLRSRLNPNLVKSAAGRVFIWHAPRHTKHFFEDASTKRSASNRRFEERKCALRIL